jgi:hypothetical protein
MLLHVSLYLELKQTSKSVPCDLLLNKKLKVVCIHGVDSTKVMTVLLTKFMIANSQKCMYIYIAFSLKLKNLIKYFRC